MIEAIDQWWKDKRDERLFRLSPSIMGHECSRYLWYRLHGAPGEEFSGRMKRLFDRGHREEVRFIEALRGIGVAIKDEQKSVMWRGEHFGSIDGLGYIDGLWHLLEFKTASEKNFKAIMKKIPHRHMVQMQIYMHLSGVTRAAYFVINKNDDTIWHKIVDYDKEFAEAQMQKAERIATLQSPPQRIDDRPEFYICKMCHLRGVCHDLA